MIDKTKIEKLVAEFISEREIFLVSVNISTGNKIKVLVNKKSGISIEECVKLSKHIEGSLDREAEDFELLVSSSGLGEAFMVPEQYEMNIGQKVEVLDNDGQKYKGLLKEFKGSSFKLETSKKSKGKKKETTEKDFLIDEIRSVKVKIAFK